MSAGGLVLAESGEYSAVLRYTPRLSSEGSHDPLRHENDKGGAIELAAIHFRQVDLHRGFAATRFPQPYSYHHLGNYGTAAQSLLFNPLMKAGFDAGFHQFDIYKFTLENTKFYQTTRPYTELAYMLGSKAEQLIDLKHILNQDEECSLLLFYYFL